jgi:hypothetical protein
MQITALQAESGEPFCSSQRAQRFVNPEQWETVFLCDVVQFPVVHEEAELLILLLDDNDGGLQGAV